MTPGPAGSVPEPRIHRLAAVLSETTGRRIEAERSVSPDGWALVWTDGPTGQHVRSAAHHAEPHIAAELRYVRRLSEEAVALGAVRLAVATTPADARRRPTVTRSAAEEFWRTVPLPCPTTERERLLVYAVIYEVRDNHRRNRAAPADICALVAQVGLAPLLRRAGGRLAPLETVTAHYAATHAHPAWRYRLAPMAATTAFEAVRDDPEATRELLLAALALLPGLPGPYGVDEAALRTRLARMPDGG
ncbi:hypothetical protein [Streptomyces sp. NPDC048560]|uniref:hypothetical protein n=1 Tax=Streptomyces sp. NPDC048560 TaxID=3155488 RepID=UPI003432495F